MLTKKFVDDLTYLIIGCAIEVHRFLGPGLLESVYKKCLLKELSLKGLAWKCEEEVPLNYKGLDLYANLRYDILVEDLVVIELKSCDGILPVHTATLLTYMKMLEKPKGILLNFNCSNIFKEGQKTMVNEFYAKLAAY